MRRPVIIAAAVLTAIALGGGGWLVLARLRHDPIASARALIAAGELHAASLELRNAVRNHPEDATAHALYGELLLQTGDPVAAEKELKQARSLHYAGPELVAELARSYLAQQRYRELLHEFAPNDAGAAPALPPAQEASLLVSRSLAQLALGDQAAGRSSAAMAQRLMPTLAAAPLAAARILALSGEPVAALHQLDRALALDPKLIEALLLQADLQRQRGDVAPAEATLDRAIAITPGLPALYLARARVRVLRGEDAGAQADLALVLKAEPKSSFARYLQALLLIRARNWTAADVALEQIQPQLPRIARGEYYQALVKSNLNQLQQAATAAEHFAARNPGDADAFRLVARIAAQLGDRTAAERALHQVALLGGAAAGTPGAAAQLPGDVAESGQAEAGDSSAALTRLAAAQLDAGNSAAAADELARSLDAAPQTTDIAALQVVTALASADVPAAAAALARLAAEPHADPLVLGNLTGLVRLAQLDFAGAQAAWEQALRSSDASGPRPIQVQMNLVRVLLLQDQPDAAEQVLRGILAAEPGERAALRGFVELAVARDHIPAALAAVAAARRALPPGTAPGAPGALGLLITEAALRARSGDYAAAYGVLEEVALEQAQAPTLLTLRAQLMLAQGRRAEAADTMRQILRATPADIALRQQLMQLLLSLAEAATTAGKPDEAAERRAEAERLAREGLAQAPGNSALLQALVALVNRTRGLDAALTEVAQARRDPVNQPTLRLLPGALYLGAKRTDAAVAAYQAELRQEPFGALAIATANALQAAGHDAAAVALLQDWVEQQPDPDVSAALANIHLQAHDYDRAAGQLAAVLAERPGDTTALNNLAWIDQQRHDPQALELATRAWLLAPSGQTADTLGWILAGEGRTATALLLLRRAVAQLPSNPTLAYHLAAVLAAAGQRDAAARLVTAVLATPVAFDDKPAAQQLQARLAALPAGK